MRVLEDLKEIMDFGPRYKVLDVSESSTANENENFHLPPADDDMSVGSMVAETAEAGHEEMNGQLFEQSNRLHVLHALNEI